MVGGPRGTPITPSTQPQSFQLPAGSCICEGLPAATDLRQDNVPFAQAVHCIHKLGPLALPPRHADIGGAGDVIWADALLLHAPEYLRDGCIRKYINKTGGWWAVPKELGGMSASTINGLPHLHKLRGG